jgi:hypothetical protein
VSINPQYLRHDKDGTRAVQAPSDAADILKPRAAAIGAGMGPLSGRSSR